MNRRHFLVNLASLSALATLPWLGACRPSAPLVVGIHTWIGYETLYLANEFKWFTGGAIQLRTNKDIGASSAQIQAGEIHAACLTLDEVLRLRSLGVPLTVALVFDVSAGADVVLVRPSMHKLADLAGKRIGVEQNALGLLMLSKLLEKARLPRSAVQIVDCPTERQLAAWRNHEIDALITFEPTPTILQREGAQRIFDSREIPDTIFDVLAVRSDLAHDHSAALESLMAGHFRALSHLQLNRQDAVYRIAARQGITSVEVQQALAGVVLPSLPANREYLALNNGRLIHAAKKLSALMVQTGLIPHEDRLEQLVSPVWLPHAAA